MVESPLVTSAVTKAVKALGAYRRARGSALDLEADFLTVQIGLKKAPVAPSAKPKLVALPHPLKDLSELSCCLIVKACDKPWLKALAVDGEKPGHVVKMTKLDGTRAASRARRDEACREDGACWFQSLAPHRQPCPPPRLPPTAGSTATRCGWSARRRRTTSCGRGGSSSRT